jgi:hypothetical protein
MPGKKELFVGSRLCVPGLLLVRDLLCFNIAVNVSVVLSYDYTECQVKILSDKDVQIYTA